MSAAENEEWTDAASDRPRTGPRVSWSIDAMHSSHDLPRMPTATSLEPPSEAEGARVVQKHKLPLNTFTCRPRLTH